MRIEVKRSPVFAMLGGEEGVRALAEAFYDVIEEDPDADALHRLHLRGTGVAAAREAQFAFLCGFFGGPRYYVERHGHARLKEIHAHVPIDAAMRDLWLGCMDKALDRRGIEGDLREEVMRNFRRAAEMVRNLPS